MIMDFFGIGQAMKGMTTVYFQSSRRTGRTVSMVESLKDGDRVCFADSREAERVSKMLRERNIENVECIVISPDDPYKLRERGTSQGRTIFDHTWVERFYLNAIATSEKDIDLFQKEMSGFGEAHLETRRKAFEMSKWNF